MANFHETNLWLGAKGLASALRQDDGTPHPEAPLLRRRISTLLQRIADSRGRRGKVGAVMATPKWLRDLLEAEGYAAARRSAGLKNPVMAVRRVHIERERCPLSPYLRGWDRACAEIGSDPAERAGA